MLEFKLFHDNKNGVQLAVHYVYDQLKNTHYGLLERGNNVEFMEIMAVLGKISSTFYRVCISRLLINSVLAQGRIQYFKEKVGVGCGGAGAWGWKAWGHWGILYKYITNYHNVYVENTIYFK